MSIGEPKPVNTCPLEFVDKGEEKNGKVVCVPCAHLFVRVPALTEVVHSRTAILYLLPLYI